MFDFALDFDPERFCRSFVRPKLGAKAANRFRAAISRPMWLLRERVLKPNLFRCQPGQDIDRASYVPIAVTPKTPGRNHFLAQQLARGDDSVGPFDPALWGMLPYFANVLRACLPDSDELTGDEIWQAPSERVLVAPSHVFTFEFDVPDIEFLRQQFGWLMAKKKPIDSLMGQLFVRLSGFVDFSGLTVVYSGNKSLHIHITFSTDLGDEVLNLGAVANPRPGFIEHWLLLRPIVCEMLRVPNGIEPDANLRFPEMYRRTPNSFRYIDNENHLLGVPPGEFVQQVTLFELWRERASAGATATFFRPGPFHAPQQEARRSPESARMIKDPSNLTAAEITFCEEQLRAWVGEWPRLDRLAHRAGRWEARFYNSPGDRNASSIMREDFATIQLIGTGADGLKPKPLLFPLGRMIWLWVEQMKRQRQSKGGEPAEVAVLLRRPNVAGNHPMEVAFRDAAVDPDAARLAAGLIIVGAVVAHQLVLIRGAEGLGKTSALTNNHHKIIQRIEALGDPALALYAFGDYLTAEAKCSDFNNAQKGNGFVGVVLPSFADAYRRACKDLRLAQLSLADAARRGYSSLWAAVRALQPAVMQAFVAMHSQMWAAVGDARMVGFTVHQVLHSWERQSPTRAMWSRSFWCEADDETERRERAMQETRLGLAVHDEVRVENVIESQPLPVLDWVKRLVATYEGDDKNTGLGRQFTAYEAFVVAEGMPAVDGEIFEIGFDDFRRLASLVDGAWANVTTADSGEYRIESEADAEADADRADIYAARHGHCWAIQPRRWWQGLAPHVVVLTTEALPTAVAARADASWLILHLDAPHLPRGVVDVHAVRGVTARNLAHLCGDWRHRLGLPNAWVVSNRVSELPNSVTHARARGSNALVGLDLIQTMTFMHPAEYEQVQALNAWMGRSDACLLRHIDEFNQTAGRNLGFRRRQGVQHHLLISPRLLAVLMAGALGHSRYDLLLHMDPGRRYRMKAE